MEERNYSLGFGLKNVSFELLMEHVNDQMVVVVLHKA